MHQHPNSWIIVGLFYPPRPATGDFLIEQWASEPKYFWIIGVRKTLNRWIAFTGRNRRIDLRPYARQRQGAEESLTAISGKRPTAT